MKKHCVFLPVLLCVISVLFLSLVTGAAAEDGNALTGSTPPVGATDILLNSKDVTIAIISDNPLSDLVSTLYPEAKIIYLNSNTDGLLALTTGNADAFVEQRATYDTALATGVTGIHLHSDGAVGEPGIVAGAVSPLTTIPDATGLANTFLAEMRSSGILDDMYQRWVVDHDYTLPDITPAENPTYTMRIGTSGLAEPYTFHIGETLTGYEIELCNRFAAWAGVAVEYYEFDWESIITACATGKVDYVFSNLYITSERSEAIMITEPYLTFETVIIVRDDETVVAPEGGSFFTALRDSFEKTFIREERWKLLLGGLWMTVRISLTFAVLGTVLGFLMCIAQRFGSKPLRTVIPIVCRVISGVPALVILLIVYFVVFGRSDIPAEAAGIIAFTVLFAVTVCGVLTSGINAIGNGQWEAAGALGIGRRQTFLRVIMPQALRIILPIYKGEFVSMMKLTSIVGYISVIDLTKAGDIIRGRTFDAFFPLIVVAFIYFLLSQLAFVALDRIDIRFDPAKHSHLLPRDVETGHPSKTDPVVSAVANTNEEIIRLEHVRKVYETVIPLTDVNASIKRGEVITVIGPSGTGKSTLLRMLNRLESQTDGKIYVFGQDIADRKTDLGLLRQRMGMVFQNFNLFEHLSVIENIMLAPVLLHRMSRQEAYDKGMQLLETVSLAERAADYPYELSGGQKQRIAIARALAMEPEAILFDEPTSALDPGMVGEVLAVIRKLSKMGLTMMIVTHEMQFAHDVSTRVFYMDQGIIYEEGTPDEIFDNPVQDRTRVFVNKLRTLQLVIDSDRYDFIAMSGKIENFAKNNYLSRHRSKNLVRCFEEVCVQPVIPASGSGRELCVAVEYDEKKDSLSMRFVWEGTRFDPVTDGDELSAKLILASCDSESFEYSDGRNTLSLHGIKG